VTRSGSPDIGAPLSLTLPGVRFTAEATVALSTVGLERRRALLHALRELAAVASLGLHGNEAGAIDAVPLQLSVSGIRVTYRVSADREIVVLRITDEKSKRLTIV
jgi:hypothetical protein